MAQSYEGMVEGVEIRENGIGIRVRTQFGPTRTFETKASPPESLLKQGNLACWDETFLGKIKNLVIFPEPFKR